LNVIFIRGGIMEIRNHFGDHRGNDENVSKYDPARGRSLLPTTYNRFDRHRKDRGDKVVVTGVIGLSAGAHAALKAVKKRPTDASNVE